jgi:hypothetical protein
MRRLIYAVTVVLFLSGLVSAQERSPADVFLENYRREIAFHEIENKRSKVEQEINARIHARSLETQFIVKMNRFVALWGALVRDYNEKQVFNIKTAGEVTKAFRDIENTGFWPNRK